MESCERYRVVMEDLCSCCVLEDEKGASHAKKLGDEGRGTFDNRAPRHLRIKGVNTLARSRCSTHVVPTPTIYVDSF